MGEIHWSLTSRTDLEEVGDFIAKDSPYYAIEFVDRILEQVESLQEFPLRGRVVPEFGLEHVHELIFANYRLIYRVIADNIYMISIHHSKRDLDVRWRKEDWEL